MITEKSEESVLERNVKNRIFTTLIFCFTGSKRALAAGLALVIVIFAFLPLTARGAEPNMVEILVKVNRKVMRTPDLYEHLTLKLKTSEDPEGLDAVEVLNIKMNMLGNEPISIGKYSGPNLYVFFTVTFDGPESTNAYQGAGVSTSYEFFSRSKIKLSIFKILSEKGKVFENMINLNPGDVFEGVAHIDPLSFKPIETTTNPLPQTDDPTPVRPLIFLSVSLAALLGLQIVIYIKTKRKEKNTVNASLLL